MSAQFLGRSEVGLFGSWYRCNFALGCFPAFSLRPQPSPEPVLYLRDNQWHNPLEIASAISKPGIAFPEVMARNPHIPSPISVPSRSATNYPDPRFVDHGCTSIYTYWMLNLYCGMRVAQSWRPGPCYCFRQSLPSKYTFLRLVLPSLLNAWPTTVMLRASLHTRSKSSHSPKQKPSGQRPRSQLPPAPRSMHHHTNP